MEQDLVAVALSNDPGRLRIATAHLRYAIDPDAEGREAVKAYEKRELSVAPTIWGMVTVSGMLDPASGATVLAALDVLMPPPRDGDPRTAGQRRADALTEICRQALDSGALPEVSGEKPHLLVTMSYASLVQQLGADPARMDRVGPISAADARMLACDCAVIPAVLDSDGDVLDIGRKSRVWPTAIVRAIVLRDRTCRHVGCDAIAQHCDIHHKHHWATTGRRADRPVTRTASSPADITTPEFTGTAGPTCPTADSSATAIGGESRCRKRSMRRTGRCRRPRG